MQILFANDGNPMNTGERLKAWAKRVKRDGLTLWFAGEHPRTPWHAKAVGVFVVAYALSPLVECRGQAEAWMDSAGAKPQSNAGAVLILALWLSVGAAAWFWLMPRP